jgi:hypothetical protein
MRIPRTLEETGLFRRLAELSQEQNLLSGEIASRRAALSLVSRVCHEAETIMGRVPVNFPEYTLHDATHLRRVAHLMFVVLSESRAVENLNYVEITVLLLSAYLHDIGMALPREDVERLLSSEEFNLFRATRRDDLRGLKELETELALLPSDEPQKVLYRRRISDIEQGILTEFLRVRHGEYGAQLILSHWSNDDQWVIEGTHIGETVAWICRGHTFSPAQLTHEYASHFPTSRLIGESEINPLYCTVILRTADILDFDRERTPSILFENISPRNSISLVEWNKHLSVQGWIISRERIVFEAECTHPVYEKALRRFLDYIDSELQNTQSIVRNFPHFGGVAEHYPFALPIRVERDRIRAKENAYRYVDLSFSLDPEQIVKLLMGREFWGGTALVVRELIQNAYDAIRHRQALEHLGGNDWAQGRIILEQRLNAEGRLELTCRDNGIGMDLYILENFFFTVGRSYYRSPQFESERAGFRTKGVEFDPISQFGLGVASAFTLGDQLRVRTRRFLGVGRGIGTAYDVEVNGFSRMAIIRERSEAPLTAGTEVTIIGPTFTDAEASDSWLDPLHLKGAVDYLAVALDVPVEVRVEAPFPEVNFIKAARPRPLRLSSQFPERLQGHSAIVLERNFTEFHPETEGTARFEFLVDSAGRVVLENEDAYWDRQEDKTRVKYVLKARKDNAVLFPRQWARALLAQDGITVATDELRSEARYYGARYPFLHLESPGSVILNLTGRAKLPLQPNRAPYSSSMSYSSGPARQWRDFKSRVRAFIAGVFEDILIDPVKRPSPDDWWKLFEIYDLIPMNLAASVAFSHLPLPVSTGATTWAWTTLADLQSEGVSKIVIDDRSYASTTNEVYSTKGGSTSMGVPSLSGDCHTGIAFNLSGRS